MPISLSDVSPAMNRDRREQLGLTLDDLAARAGVDPQDLTAYEHAKSAADANPTVALKIGDALDAFESEIATDDQEPEAHPT